jgi:hypothetical protein
MSNRSRGGSDYARLAAASTVLETSGDEIRPGLWENGVYVSDDGFVFHLIAEEARGKLKITVIGKRAVGEYLRWVDGLFRPGEVPSETNAIHFRAAKKLRELI